MPLVEAVVQNFIKKRLYHRCFACEICGIFKNTFFYITAPVAASALATASEKKNKKKKKKKKTFIANNITSIKE